MVATRLIPLHVNNGKTIAQSLGDRTDYAKNPEKTEKGEAIDFWWPDVHAGVLGVKWVEKCVESADKDAAWVEY